MPTPVKMPRLSDTMKEGTIASWLKKPGDTINKGDILGEIETDKATMELEAHDAGVLVQILVQEGETVPVGTDIALIAENADVSELFSPLSGEILRANKILKDHPELINHSPYEDGWMLRVKLSKPAELDGLMSADEYKQYLLGRQGL